MPLKEWCMKNQSYHIILCRSKYLRYGFHTQNVRKIHILNICHIVKQCVHRGRSVLLTLRRKEQFVPSHQWLQPPWGRRWQNSSLYTPPSVVTNTNITYLLSELSILASYFNDQTYLFPHKPGWVLWWRAVNCQISKFRLAAGIAHNRQLEVFYISSLPPTQASGCPKPSLSLQRPTRDKGKLGMEPGPPDPEFSLLSDCYCHHVLPNNKLREVRTTTCTGWWSVRIQSSSSSKLSWFL